MSENNKNVNLVFHKDQAHWESFDKILTTISKKDVRKIIHAFSETFFSEDSCMNKNDMQIDIKESFNKTSDGILRKQKSLIVSNFYWGGLKFLCKEQMIGDSNSNNYYRIINCFQNLSCGKCKCPFMLNVIGKIALPELYNNKSR